MFPESMISLNSVSSLAKYIHLGHRNKFKNDLVSAS